MARKIAVISTYSDDPSGEHLKKSVAQLEVRRLLADWVVEGVSIRRRAIRKIPAAVLFAKAPRTRVPRPYIPTILPPAEIPGVFFALPGPRIRDIRAVWDWQLEPWPLELMAAAANLAAQPI
jgi:hypothetical protein